MPEPNKVPVKSEKSSAATVHPLRPLENLRREVNRLFEDFAGGMWRSPLAGRSLFDMDQFWRTPTPMTTMPAVDVAEIDTAYEITAELPGLDEKNIEVKVADGTLIIRGEKQEEKEEKKKDYYLSERSYGSFQRSFQIPSGVDPDKIEASFNKGVLKITLAKSADALKAEKNIAIKAA